MSREPIPTWTFALVVVRHEDRFLLTHERKHGQRWYLPAGRVEPGESLHEGARREAFEETGVSVRLTGVLSVHYTPVPGPAARLRVTFVGEPAGDPTPLAVPGNEHALEARWVTLAEAGELRLRGLEVLSVLQRVQEEGALAPLHLLGSEE
ncbi:MAG TPA: NUDIX hydrolase [Planctomycetes bacterium]|nr:NUDIX hydrolase [Planctomycetota bacterium]